MAAPAAHAASGEIPSLDGWRAIAILTVFLSHAGLGNIIPGGFGVTIFFFLSGFLITSLMLAERRRRQRISIPRFYLRRLIRLSPPLLITLVAVYSLTHFGKLAGAATLQGFLAQAFYFANYYGIFFDPGNTTPAGTGIFWSLAVEEHFYFFFPWVFTLLSRKDDNRNLVIVLTALCVLVLAWRCQLVFELHAAEFRTFYASDTRIDSIIFGGLLALTKNPILDESRVAPRTYRMLIAASIGLILFSILYRSAGFRETFRYTVQGIALAPLFYYSIKLHRSWPFRTLNSRVMKYIGRCSYSIYLIHFVLLVNLRSVTPYAAVNVALCFVLALAFAAIVDKAIDQPLRAVRLRYK